MTTDTTDIAVREEAAITRADPEQAAGALQHILATGDLSKLTNEQRVATYLQQCSTLGLNPISRPFDWLLLDGKLVLYPNKSCAEQLRRIHQISTKVTRFEVLNGTGPDPMVVCTVEGRRPNGQTDESTKYLSLLGWNNRTQKSYRLSGRELSNAYGKVETAAKRRLTLSMIGLAAPPDDIKNARQVIVDGTGRIIDNPTDMDRALAEDPGLAKMLKEPTYETMADGSESPLPGRASQAPTIDELTPPTRPYRPPARFHCDVEKWRGMWFTVVRDTYLDDDDARHDFIKWWTSSWPEARRTDSLGAFLEHATDRQAEALINAAREHLAEEAEARANDPDGELDGIDGVTEEQARQIDAEQRGQASRPAVDERVQDAAVLTGTAPSASTAGAPGVERPVPGQQYTRAQWVEFCRQACARLRQLDVTFVEEDFDKLRGQQLADYTLRVIEEADAIEEAISAAGAPDADDQGDDSAPMPF